MRLSEKKGQIINTLLTQLGTLESWIEEFPPIQQPQRFGNKAFRLWIERLESESSNIVSKLLPPSHSHCAKELAMYFQESFGNGTRIDYGTGHEFNFAAFLCGLDLLSILQPPDYTALVLKVFKAYLQLIRKIQATYQLEPAGSHGVWGLDDFHFLSYYWGSAQLLGTLFGTELQSVCNL
jgi:serine/threonine-protein phosphatase 2A activator